VADLVGAEVKRGGGREALSCAALLMLRKTRRIAPGDLTTIRGKGLLVILRYSK
jgi:hypothetical protein